MTAAQRRWLGLALGVVLVLPLLVPFALRLRVQRTANALRARIEAARERHARSGPHTRGHPSSSCEVAATLVASGAADLPRADLVTSVERALACESSWERSGARWSVLMEFAAANTHLEGDACLRHAVLSFRLADRLSAGSEPLLPPIAPLLRCADTASASARADALRDILPLALDPLPLWHATHPAALATADVCANALDDMVSGEMLLAATSSALTERDGARAYAERLSRLEADGDRAIEFLDLTSSRADDVASMRDEAIGLSYGGFGRPNLILGAIDSVEAFRQQMRMAAVALGADTSDPRLASVFTAEPMLVEHSSDGVSVTYTTHDTLRPVAVLTPSGETELRRLDGSLIRRIRRR